MSPTNATSQMLHIPIPSRAQQNALLLRFFFGEACANDPLRACVERAYRDFNRTLHGMRQLDVVRHPLPDVQLRDGGWRFPDTAAGRRAEPQ